MEYIGLTHEVARNIYMGAGVAAVAFFIPFVTKILRPILNKVVDRLLRNRLKCHSELLQAVQLGFNPQITQISQITDEMGEKSERHIAVETQDIVSLHVST
ncbi:hypothetical protein KKE26_02145, partial [bacterium]|nr:hypothetical protein [bacterium]